PRGMGHDKTKRLSLPRLRCKPFERSGFHLRLLTGAGFARNIRLVRQPQRHRTSLVPRCDSPGIEKREITLHVLESVSDYPRTICPRIIRRARRNFAGE